MSNISVIVTLALYALTQIGGGIALISSLRTRATESEKRAEKLELSFAALAAKLETNVASLRSEFHTDLSAIRSELTNLAVQVGRTQGRQDAR